MQRKPAKNNWKSPAVLLLAGGLLSCFLSACTGQPASSSLSASSAPSSSSLPVSSAPAPSSSSAPQSLPPQPAEPEPLHRDDFAVYLDGAEVLDLDSVAFGRFSFLLNAEGNRLDPLAISTKRGLRVGDSQQTVERLYSEIPMDVRQTGAQPGERESVGYDNFADFLAGEEIPADYHAVFFLYYIDGQPEYDLGVIEAALGQNAYAPNHEILRYDLDVHIQAGGVTDITLAKNDLTPYALGAMQAGPLLETEQLTVAATALSNQNGGLALGLAIQSRYDEPVLVVATATMVNGKATRDVGFLNQYLDPYGYADALLVIPNDAIRAADVERVESVSLVLEVRTEQDRVLYKSDTLTVPVQYPEDPAPEEGAEA